jgi:hypothetical protein
LGVHSWQLLQILCRYPGTAYVSKKLLDDSGETTRSVKCDMTPYSLIVLYVSEIPTAYIFVLENYHEDGVSAISHPGKF